MGEVTRTDIIKLLRDENPEGHEHDFAIYADSFLSYQAAAANIAKNGDIVLHPRTGQPIENPYNSIREKAAAALRKIPLNVRNLWDSPARWLVAIADKGAQEPGADNTSRCLRATPKRQRKSAQQNTIYRSSRG